MDLEELKREWQRDVSETEIEERVIRKMISKENRSVLDRIKKREEQALRIIPISTMFFVFVSLKMIFAGGFAMFWVLLFIPLGALLWYWNYYLCGFLNKIDMARMSVAEVTKRVLKYKTYLIRHTVVSVVFLPLYMGVWLYQYFATMQLHEGMDGLNLSDGFDVSFIAGYLIFILAMFFVIIWFRYFKEIGKLQENLKMIEDFQREE